MRVVISVIIAVCAITGCQTTSPSKYTPSGRAEIVLSMPQDEVVGKLAEVCMDEGLVVNETSQFHVLCSKKLEGMKAVAADMLAGDDAQRYVRFTVVKTSKGTRIQSYDYLEGQNRFGKTKRYELKQGHQVDGIQKMLDRLKNAEK